MKPKFTLLTLLIIFIISAVSCGTSAKRSLADGNVAHTEAVIDNAEMTVYLDDHTRTRKNADAIFSAWADSRHIGHNITGKRLLAVSLKEDGCDLTYDFRLVDGNKQRVTLKVTDYKQVYRKKHKQINSAIVNGKKYDFKH